MKRNSIATIRLHGRTGKLIRLYAQDHGLSMGEFLSKTFETIPIEDILEETSDRLTIEERKHERTSGLTLQEIKAKHLPKPKRSRRKTSK